MNRSILILLILIAAPAGAFADWKLTQKMKIGGEKEGGQATTIFQKGVRQRRETKIDMGSEADDPEVRAMMEQEATTAGA